MSMSTFTNNPMAGAETARKGTVIDPNTGKQLINLSALPADVQGYLQQFDSTNSGYIDAEELSALARQSKGNQDSNALFRKIMGGMGLLTLMVILTTFALSFAVFELSKETTVDGDGVLKAYHSGGEGMPIRVDALDSVVKEGALTDRATGLPLGTTEAVKTIDGSSLSSSAPNEFFHELKNFAVSDPSGSVLDLEVRGFLRRAAASGNLQDSTVTLFTPAGDIYVQGDQLSFSAAVGERLTQAGFATTEDQATGRRLLFITGEHVFAGFVTVVIIVGAGACIASGPMCVAVMASGK